MKKALVVFNPVAGVEEAGHFLAPLTNRLTQEGYLPLVLATQKEGDEEIFVKTWGPEVNLVICLGGDGTLSRVVSGLLSLKPRPDLAYIPAGSTNDFASGVGMGKLHRDDLVDLACQGKASLFDVGSLNDRSFIYVAAFGLFTSVAYRTSQDQKNLLGRLAYFFEGVKDLTQIKTHSLKLRYDEGELEGDYILGLVSNSESVAGFSSITGPTDYYDGLFEVLLVKAAAKPLDLAGALHDLIAGRDNALILRLRTTKLDILSQDDLAWTLDGEEGFKGKESRIRVLPKALSIRTPLGNSADEAIISEK